MQSLRKKRLSSTIKHRYSANGFVQRKKNVLGTFDCLGMTMVTFLDTFGIIPNGFENSRVLE